MKAFLEYVLKNLVDAPDQVSVQQTTRSGRTAYDIRVRPGDVGKVVGKQGQTIAAIRSIMNAAASRYGERVEVEILEDEPPVSSQQTTATETTVADAASVKLQD